MLRAPAGAKLPKFRFNGDAQALAHYIRRKTKLIHGGYGSGKSVLHHLHYIEQSEHDTDQIHGLFTNTNAQLVDGILPDMEKRLKRAGIELEFDREPPASWFRKWEKYSVSIPSLKKYRNIATLSTGIHIVCGTLHHQSFRQFQSIDFRTLRIEEVFNCSRSAVMTMIPRCRCGDADDMADDDIEVDDDYEPDCGHLHDVTLLGNPPLGPHWIFEWLDKREEVAKRRYSGPPVDHRKWELLRAGVGTTIIIKSSTRDNLRNLGQAYLEELEAEFSPDVATRLIDGDLVRESAGRAFTQFTSEGNVSDVAYDPDRLVYVWLDFDLRPRAAVFAHRLERGEYPEQGSRDRSIVHYGVFGEFFNEAPMANREFIEELMRGGRGMGGDCEYPNERYRGLPQSWQGLRKHDGQIILSGDARGRDKSRHNDTMASDWQMVRQVMAAEFGEEEGGDGHYSITVPHKNPEPSVRIHTLNGKFGSMAGVRSIHIDPICKHLLKDAESCEWDEAGHDLRHCGAGFGGTLWMRTHLIAALGYGVFPLSPYGIDHDPAADIPAGRLPRRTVIESFI